MTTETASQIIIGADSANPLTVNRIGYGTMRLTGEGIWGEPKNREEALQILKKAEELGVNYIDTADYYGLGVTNRLIAEALYPYSQNLVIGTKIGCTRGGDKSWIKYNKPDELRISVENNLKQLKLDKLALVHYRVLQDDDESFKKSMQIMFEMQQEGKILHVGVSNVTPNFLKIALDMGEIATVENMYGHAQRASMKNAHGESQGGSEVLELCEQNEVALIPYFSLVHAMGKKDTRIAEIAQKYNVAEAQVNIAWLLHKSPWILPIPGTSSLAHFEQNIKAKDISLSKEDMEFLE